VSGLIELLYFESVQQIGLVDHNDDGKKVVKMRELRVRQEMLSQQGEGS